LKKTTYPNFEILLAVNTINLRQQSKINYLKALKGDHRVRLLVYPDQPYNYSRINNWAAGQASGSIICLLNDDTEIISEDWLEQFAVRLALPKVGAVGALLYYLDKSIQHAGVTLGINGVAAHSFIGLPSKGDGFYFGRSFLEQDLSCVTAACMAVRRDLFETLGGFNERLVIAFNDVDLCIRIRRAGWRIIWTPKVQAYHHESASLGRHNSEKRIDQFHQEIALIRKMWTKEIEDDPFYNPNLTLDRTDFRLAFPPRIAPLPEAAKRGRPKGWGEPYNSRNIF